MDMNTHRLSAAEVAQAKELLAKAPFGYLAMIEGAGPYVVPLNFVFEAAAGPASSAPVANPSGGTGAASSTSSEVTLFGHIFFHTGEGRKTAALDVDPRVSLALTASATFYQGGSPCADGFFYRSLLVWGEAHRIEEPGKREAALRAIVSKYDPAADGASFDEAHFTQTLLYEVTIEAASWKEQPRRPAG